MDFTDARHQARMTRNEVQDYLKLSRSTINRYEKTGKAPKAVTECLMMIGGHCPNFSRRNDFTGWSFGQGYLWSNSGLRFTSGDILALPVHYQLITAQNQTIEKLRNLSLHDKVSNIIQFPNKRFKNNLVA